MAYAQHAKKKEGKLRAVYLFVHSDIPYIVKDNGNRLKLWESQVECNNHRLNIEFVHKASLIKRKREKIFLDTMNSIIKRLFIDKTFLERERERGREKDIVLFTYNSQGNTAWNLPGVLHIVKVVEQPRL